MNPAVHTFGGSDSVFVGKRAYDVKSPDMNMFYFVIYNSVQAIAYVTPKMPNDPIDPSSPEVVETKLRQHEGRKKMVAGNVKPSEKKKKRKHR